VLPGAGVPEHAEANASDAETSSRYIQKSPEAQVAASRTNTAPADGVKLIVWVVHDAEGT
jgi:hypothetical protein